MAKKSLNGSLRSLLAVLEVQLLRGASDQELVRRFAQSRDEAAFRVIAERHGPMVHGVCRRALGCPHDAEDALQATFLIFAQRAGSIRKSTSLASWLHGVARRVTSELRRSQRRRLRRERGAAAARPANPADEVRWAEVKTGLDEELERLPAAYRDVLVLCYLEGQTRDEAAQRLGVDVGVVKGRLERGRKMLADRLRARGLTLSAGLLAVAVSPSTVSATAKAAALVAGCESVAEVVSPSVLGLTTAVMKGMAMSKLKMIAASFVCSLVLVGGVGFGIAQTGSGPGAAQSATSPKGAVSDGGRKGAPDARDSDEAFIRRVSLDLRGIEPSPAEVHFFVRSKDAKRREILVDLFIKQREAKQKQAAATEQAFIGAAHRFENWEVSMSALVAANFLGDPKALKVEIEALKRRISELETDIAGKLSALEELLAWRKLKGSDANGKGSPYLFKMIERLKTEMTAAQLDLREAIVQRDAAVAQEARGDATRQAFGVWIKGPELGSSPPPQLRIKKLELVKDRAVLNLREKKLLLEQALAEDNTLVEKRSREMRERIASLRHEVERAEIELDHAENNLARGRQKESNTGVPSSKKP
jgi:RNA polymerase sigma factor (sigma-70 family)